MRKKLKKYVSNFKQNTINLAKGMQKGVKKIQEMQDEKQKQQIINQQRQLKRLQALDKSLTLKAKIEEKKRKLKARNSGLGGSLF